MAKSEVFNWRLSPVQPDLLCLIVGSARRRVYRYDTRNIPSQGEATRQDPRTLEEATCPLAP
jgi:hypothetical protein